MTYSHYGRLSALDTSFLELEDANCPMHVGAVAVFEAGPLSRPDGGFDIERFRRFVEAVLQPRYRQRIVPMPVTKDPIWVDDPHLNEPGAWAGGAPTLLRRQESGYAPAQSGGSAGPRGRSPRASRASLRSRPSSGRRRPVPAEATSPDSWSRSGYRSAAASSSPTRVQL